MHSLKNFIFPLIVFSIVLAAADYAWIRFVPVDLHFPHPWLILAFFTAVTFLFHAGILKASKKKPMVLIRFYMISAAVKLFAYIIIIAVYMLTDKIHGRAFALGFLGHYFLFSIFEVRSLVRQFKR